MLNNFHKSSPIRIFLKKLSNISSRWKSNKIKRATFMPNKENLDLAYASYESTEMFSKNNPEPTPLLILHGIMGSKNNWNSLCKKIHNTKMSKVIAVDARNHGESPHTKWHSYDNLVVDVRQFIEKMNLKSFNLMGHCMGGRTAMLFALKYPELVEKLVIVDISPVSTSLSIKKINDLLKLMYKLKLPKNVSTQEAIKIVSDGLNSMTKNKAVLTFLMTNLVKKADGRFGWRVNLRALIEHAEYLLSFPDVHNSTYNGPVLFLGGGLSDYIQKSDYPKILELFPNAELKYIEGAGHWLHSDKPDEFLRYAMDFLNKKVVST